MAKKTNYKQGRNTKSNYSGKGRGSKSKYVKPEVQEVKSDSDINDLSYYIPDGSELLVSQLNTYSFDAFAGVKYPMGRVEIRMYESPNTRSTYTPELANANVMQLVVNPSVTYTDLDTPQTAGINMVGLRNYTRFSAENGKTTQYMPADPTILMLAVGQVLALFSFGARALGLFRTYNYRNRSYPRSVIAAAGIAPGDVMNGNFAKCLMDYNSLINKFNKIPIPRNIRYFDKCSKMFQNVYLDEEGSSMAQSYIMIPETTWTYEEDGTPGVSVSGSLKTTYLCEVVDRQTGFLTTTWNNYVNVLDGMISALLNSSLLNFVYSDILRIATKQGVELLKLSELDASYSILPSKSEEISLWINNATVIGRPWSMEHENVIVGEEYTKDNDVVQSPTRNAIMYRPMFASPSNLYPVDFKYLLNFKHDNPSIDEKVAATRLHVNGKVTPGTNTLSGSDFQVRYAEMNTCDWYLSELRLSTCASENETAVTIDRSMAIVAVSRSRVPQTAALTKFDWAPYLYLIENRATGGEGIGNIQIYGDTQYYTNITFDNLKRMNDVAMMGLFEIH